MGQGQHQPSDRQAEEELLQGQDRLRAWGQGVAVPPEPETQTV